MLSPDGDVGSGGGAVLLLGIGVVDGGDIDVDGVVLVVFMEASLIAILRLAGVSGSGFEYEERDVCSSDGERQKIFLFFNSVTVSWAGYNVAEGSSREDILTSAPSDQLLTILSFALTCLLFSRFLFNVIECVNTFDDVKFKAKLFSSLTSVEQSRRAKAITLSHILTFPPSHSQPLYNTIV